MLSIWRLPAFDLLPTPPNRCPSRTTSYHDQRTFPPQPAVVSTAEPCSTPTRSGMTPGRLRTFVLLMSRLDDSRINRPPPEQTIPSRGRSRMVARRTVSAGGCARVVNFGRASAHLTEIGERNHRSLLVLRRFLGSLSGCFWFPVHSCYWNRRPWEESLFYFHQSLLVNYRLNAKHAKRRNLNTQICC